MANNSRGRRSRNLQGCVSRFDELLDARDEFGDVYPVDQGMMCLHIQRHDPSVFLLLEAPLGDARHGVRWFEQQRKRHAGKGEPRKRGQVQEIVVPRRFAQ